MNASVVLLLKTLVLLAMLVILVIIARIRKKVVGTEMHYCVKYWSEVV